MQRDNIRVWRSLVSRLNGVQEALSSNLNTRTTKVPKSVDFGTFFVFGRLPNKRKTMHDAAIAVVKKRAYNRRAVVSSKNIAVPSCTARHLLNILLMLRIERLGHYSIKGPVEYAWRLHRPLCIKTVSREMTEKNGEISEGR